MRSKFICLIAAMLFTTAHAASIEQPLADAAQEATARNMFSELKCVVCEGQSLADSDAKLAIQMRSHIRRELEGGKTREAIYADFRKQYGDHIFLTPPVTPRTYMLWLAPLLLLGIGFFLVKRMTKAAPHE